MGAGGGVRLPLSIIQVDFGDMAFVLLLFVAAVNIGFSEGGTYFRKYDNVELSAACTSQGTIEGQGPARCSQLCSMSNMCTGFG